MGNYKAEIGKRVSYLRNLNGLTQENLAELLDCSVNGSLTPQIPKRLIKPYFFSQI